VTVPKRATVRATIERLDTEAARLDEETDRRLRAAHADAHRALDHHDIPEVDAVLGDGATIELTAHYAEHARKQLAAARDARAAAEHRSRIAVTLEQALKLGNLNAIEPLLRRWPDAISPELIWVAWLDLKSSGASDGFRDDLCNRLAAALDLSAAEREAEMERFDGFAGDAIQIAKLPETS
jgi:hypothetical protein